MTLDCSEASSLYQAVHRTTRNATQGPLGVENKARYRVKIILGISIRGQYEGQCMVIPVRVLASSRAVWLACQAVSTLITWYFITVPNTPDLVLVSGAFQPEDNRFGRYVSRRSLVLGRVTSARFLNEKYRREAFAWVPFGRCPQARRSLNQLLFPACYPS